MRILLKIINRFFVTLGVIFFIIICLGVYIFIVDPFGIRSSLSILGTMPGSELSMPKDSVKGSFESAGINLSPEQKKLLESAGIDPAMAPTGITKEMEECFVEKLGVDRVKEIESGELPGVLDIIKAGSCLSK